VSFIPPGPQPSGRGRIVVVLVLAVVVALLIYGFWPRGEPAQPAKPKPETGGRVRPIAGSGPAPRAEMAQSRPAATEKSPAPDAEQARRLLKKGLDLLAKGRLVEARSALADALNSGVLSPSQAQTARASLAKLAEKMLFSPRVFPGDPCAFWYTFKPGQVLVRVERDLKLHVPAQLILRINGLSSGQQIRAGQRLKMVRGPFHAVVDKGRFVMDVYLQEPGTGRRIFVRRYRVGTGKDGSTPVGRWRVSLGGKMDKAPWTPPPSSDLPQRKILWGQPGYPLGAKGYWIGLEGIEGNPHTREEGYGIHGTNDETSIGRAVSMGCIRLSDGDIEEVFSMLYEHWSTVTVVK